MAPHGFVARPMREEILHPKGLELCKVARGQAHTPLGMEGGKIAMVLSYVLNGHGLKTG